MTRRALERRQVWIYLGAALGGLALGSVVAEATAVLEAAVWPVLGLLLFATFTQVPLIRLPAAFRDGRFMGAMLAGNFLLVPLLVACLLWALPDDPALRLGVLLVLLVPCTDWYITFTHLAGGDTGRAIAATPVNLILQMLLLPVFLWLFLGSAFGEIFAVGPILASVLGLIAGPLAAAWLLERWAAAGSDREIILERLGWLPVPLLAVVVFLIAASQVGTVSGALPLLPRLSGVFLAYLLAALLLGVGMSRILRLPGTAGRALTFSLGTRNSFVVLPLALALEPEWRLAIVVIVVQSLVELFGVMLYLKLVPRLLPAT